MSSNVRDGRGGKRLPAKVTSRRHTSNFGMFFGGKGLYSESEVEPDGLAGEVGCSMARVAEDIGVHHSLPDVEVAAKA
jgi:hypothetical protein